MMGSYLVAFAVLVSACDGTVPAPDDAGGIRFDAGDGGASDVVRARVMGQGDSLPAGLSDLEPMPATTVMLRQHTDGALLEGVTDAAGFVRFNGVDWTAPVDLHVANPAGTAAYFSLLGLTPEHVVELEAMGWAPDGVPLFAVDARPYTSVGVVLQNAPVEATVFTLSGARSAFGSAYIDRVMERTFRLPREDEVQLYGLAYRELDAPARGYRSEFVAGLRMVRDVASATEITIDFAAATPTNTIRGSFRLPDGPYFERHDVMLWPYGTNWIANGMPTRIEVDDATRTVSYEIESVDAPSETRLWVSYGGERRTWDWIATDGEAPRLVEPGEMTSPAFDVTVTPGTTIRWRPPAETRITRFWVSSDSGTLWTGWTLAPGELELLAPPTPLAGAAQELRLFGCARPLPPEHESSFCSRAAHSGSRLFAAE